MIVFSGNCPASVKRDAKYSVVHGASQQMEIRLTYEIKAGTRALLTTKSHTKLVGLVNDVKEEATGQMGGAFYINEFCQVIVPADGTYYLAGEYSGVLEFDLDGSKIIKPTPPPDLEPGHIWPGPHVGIPYTITADASDIKYESRAGNIVTTHKLSDHVSTLAARKLARRLNSFKSQPGGRIYINEAREFFAPRAQEEAWDYIYLGPLDDDEWFPRPG